MTRMRWLREVKPLSLGIRYLRMSLGLVRQVLLCSLLRGLAHLEGAVRNLGSAEPLFAALFSAKYVTQCHNAKKAMIPPTARAKYQAVFESESLTRRPSSMSNV